MKTFKKSGEKPEGCRIQKQFKRTQYLDQGLLREVTGHPSQEDLSKVGRVGTSSRGRVAQTMWRRPEKCFIQVCLGNNSHNKLVNTPHRPRLQICCRASLQRQQSWSLWLRLLKPVLGELRDMSKTCSKVGLPAASLASCCHLGGVAGSDDATKKTRGSGRCGPCFHLLQQLLHLDATAAAAPQKKVAMTKVQSESQRAVAIWQQQSPEDSQKRLGRRQL